MRGLAIPALATALLAAAVRLPGLGERGAAPSAVAVAGVLTAAIAALVAGRLAGSRAAAWAGALVALSPIHVLASRQAGPEAPFVLVLVLALALLARVEESGSRWSATALGLAVALLAASGVATLGEVPSWVPAATVAGVARCAGASFTRVAGIEYHLVVPHARHVLPLTALFVGLMARGAARLPSRWRWLLLAGATLPFALGVALSLAVGRVAPLQATRLLPALPFVVLLMAAGLASLRGWRAWAAGTAVAGSVAAFLALALAW